MREASLSSSVGCRQAGDTKRGPREGPEKRHSIFELMGQSGSIQQIHRQIQLVARTNFTVIIEGETGTGKELVARLIHEHSDRADKAFVAIDCGAIPDSLVESELFGYVKGAFTGAEGRKAGYFELAKGGTLFLDEIAHLSPTIQMKVLRSLQERCVLPLGSAHSVPIDVRLVVASNAILEEEVCTGRFRADLFHRLNEFKISLVPLRERRKDILVLADRFRRETNAELGKQSADFCDDAKAYLLVHDWPGNVRELRNTVRRAVLLSHGVIELQHLRQRRSLQSEPRVEAHPLALQEEPRDPGRGLHAIIHDAVVQLEKSLIHHALAEAHNNKKKAAKTLHIGYKTLYRKLREHNML
jgi:DNA-binding NtrC family response regulator